jgi:hypothetical protein
MTPSEIMHKMIDALNINITILADEINEKKATLYQVTSGRNGISKRLANKIKDRYPQVNINFLLKGEGEPVMPITETLEPNPSNNTQQEILRQLHYLNLKIDKMGKEIELLTEIIKNK